jgi:hypothetical protein
MYQPKKYLNNIWRIINKPPLTKDIVADSDNVPDLEYWKTLNADLAKTYIKISRQIPPLPDADSQNPVKNTRVGDKRNLLK